MIPSEGVPGEEVVELDGAAAVGVHRLEGGVHLLRVRVRVSVRVRVGVGVGVLSGVAPCLSLSLSLGLT